MTLENRFIVCPTVIETEGELAAEVDVDLLREQLVYWNKIHVISHSHAPVLRDANLDFLKQNGILSYKNFKLGVDLSDGITDDYQGPPDYPFRILQAELSYDVVLFKALSMIDNADGSIVSYGEPQRRPRIIEQLQKRSTVLQLKLHNLLPKPSANVSFEDIIRFRQNRSDELSELQFAIQKLIRDAQADPDSMRGESLAVNDLGRALKNLNAVSAESRLMRAMKSGLRVTVAISSGAAVAAGAEILSQMNPEIFKIPVGLAFGVGATLPLIEGLIHPDYPVRARSHDLASFEYANLVEKEL